MKNAGAAIALVMLGVVVQFVAPARDVYRAGWFNVAIAALVAVALIRLRSEFASAGSGPARRRSAALALGIALLGASGIACGLFAPDPVSVVAAPGSSAVVPSFGRTIDFPPLDGPPVPSLSLGGSALLLRAFPRTVVEVEAFDSRGARLTITQPSGAGFLSPVLLMQSRQTIASMNLPFDSFAVPAAHRLVKAVLFNAQEAAQLRAAAGRAGPAVLFDVEDQNERPLAKGLALAHGGETVDAAGLRLRAEVAAYPGIEAIAVPNVFGVAGGLIAIAAGLRNPFRS